MNAHKFSHFEFGFDGLCVYFWREANMTGANRSRDATTAVFTGSADWVELLDLGVTVVFQRATLEPWDDPGAARAKAFEALASLEPADMEAFLVKHTEIVRHRAAAKERARIVDQIEKAGR